MAIINNAAVAVPLIAAVVSVWMKWCFDQRLARQKNAFDLQKELHSKDMLDARHAAWAFIKEHEDLNLANLHQRDDLAPAAKPVWQIVHFFHRVSASHKNRYVEGALTFELFGELFVWWHYILMEKALSETKWQAKDEIDWLYRRFEQRPELKRRPYRLLRWMAKRKRWRRRLLRWMTKHKRWRRRFFRQEAKRKQTMALVRRQWVELAKRDAEIAGLHGTKAQEAAGARSAVASATDPACTVAHAMNPAGDG